MTQLFNQRALRKRHRVGDRNGPITLLTPPLRLTLLMGLMIAVGGGLWATLARIPISVQGTGVLLPVSTINSSLSGTKGTAHWLFNRPPAGWQQQALRFLQRPDQLNDDQMTALATAVLQASEDVRQSTPEASGAGPRSSSAARFAQNLDNAYYGRRIPAGTLLLWIQSGAYQERLQSALDQVQRTQRDNQEQGRNINAKQQILGRELSSRSSYLEQMQALEGKGFVSRASILQEQAQVDNIRSQILSNRNELIRLGNQLDQAYQGLRKELASLISQEMIFTEKAVYLSQVIPNDGETVSQGQPVLELSSDELNDPTLVPLFLSSKEMAQVFPGMPALATPSGYKRSEVGGIRAEVVSMAKIPSSLDDVTARIGVRSLAQVIMQREPAPSLAVLKLKRASAEGRRNTGGYQWSSRGDLPFPPTPGDRLNVEITTRKVAPIELVLPALRRFFGWSPPQPPPGPAAGTPPTTTP